MIQIRRRAPAPEAIIIKIDSPSSPSHHYFESVTGSFS